MKISIFTFCCFWCILSCEGAFAVEVQAKTLLKRGHLITENDIGAVPSTAPNANDILSQYVGQELNRTIYPGSNLQPNYVVKPILVRRNTLVTMVFRHGRLEIVTMGRALDEGGQGDMIALMNLDSKTRIRGTILEDGSIEVLK